MARARNVGALRVGLRGINDPGPEGREGGHCTSSEDGRN